MSDPSPSEPLRFVSFLSDYGQRDEFVGVCKGVMLGVAPHLSIVDITHDVPPFDIRAGALTLSRAVQYLPAGVVLAIVDPGVGTARRCIAIEVENGYLVGPDNGLLAPAVAMLGGPRRVVALTSEEHRLDAPSETFAGRDVMAPAAAYLADGLPITDLGDVIDAASLVPGMLPLPSEADDGALVGEVLWVDRFGNCQLNLDADLLRAHDLGPGDGFEVRVGDTAGRVRWVSTFADAKPSELVVLVDSYGLLALALDRQSAAERHHMGVGTAVTLLPEGAGAPDAGVIS
ncbi:MAG TPA: SAM-dependent chlorinase/fluorinase [Acidimicrobiia bacterium]|nr:SAM-dependent chlorinase/fluorinase [Acidimicrobiia bacterium]